MTAFHVLTGLHAGASLSLAPGRYRVSGEAESNGADRTSAVARITLFDWSSAPLNFQVDGHGMVMICSQEDVSELAFADAWPMRQTRCFGTVTLCLQPDGGSGETEDSPRSLSGRSFSSAATVRKPAAAASSTARASSSWGTRAGFVGAGLLVAVSALYGHTGTPPPELRAQSGFDCEWLEQNLATRGLHELRVEKENDAIVVSGLVRNVAEGQSARIAAAEFLRSSAGPIVARWEVADVIASTIETALRHPGVHAVYDGDGRFSVQGLVADPEAFRSAAEPLRKDLGPNVRNLEFAVHAAHRPVPVNAAIAAGALHYSERTDGAKVFSQDAKGM